MAFGVNNGYSQPMYGNSFMGGGQPQGFPQMNMQQSMQNMNMQIAQPTPQPNGAIWVQGEAGAKSYLVGAGNTVILWDSEKINSEKPVIYIKSADSQGVPSMQAFELSPVNSETNVSKGDFVTREEFEVMRHNLEILLEKENERQARYEKKKHNNVNKGATTNG